MRRVNWTDAEIESWVPQVLADAGLRSTGEIERFSGGFGGCSFRAGRDYTVRFGARSGASCTRRSVEVMRAIQGRVRCPTVLYADFSCQSIPCNAIVYSYLRGEPLGNCWNDLKTEKRRHYITQVVEQLSNLFATPWRGMVSFTEQQDWSQYTWDRLASWFSEAYGQVDFPNACLDRMMENALNWRWSLEVVSDPVLIHGDVNWGNTIIDGEDVVGLIDFDNVEIGTADIEAWRLVGAIVSHGDTAIREAVSWIDDALPGVMYAPGAPERFGLEQVYEILWSLTQSEADGAGTREDALRDAMEDYRLLFCSDYYRDWFPQSVYGDWWPHGESWGT